MRSQQLCRQIRSLAYTLLDRRGGDAMSPATRILRNLDTEHVGKVSRMSDVRLKVKVKVKVVCRGPSQSAGDQRWIVSFVIELLSSRVFLARESHDSGNK